MLIFAVVLWFVLRPQRDSNHAVESIAVLPLHNASGNAEHDYLAVGMTDALINELASFQELRVTSRTSVARFRERELFLLPEIGRELKVDAVLEGSVLPTGSGIGLTVQLVDAAADRQIWSGSYERDLEDVLRLRKEVARAVVNEIRLVLSPAERASLDVITVVDPKAYDAYQKGLYYLQSFTGEGLLKAIEHAQEALDHDPDFSLAHALLAEAYGALTYVSRSAPKEYSALSRESANRAVSLAPDLSDAHRSLAWIQSVYDWNWEGAEASYQRAIQLRPGSSPEHAAFAHFLAAMGRFDQAVQNARKAETIDPINPVVMETMAFVLFLSRRYDESISESRNGLELHPGYAFLQIRLARALAEVGRIDEAIVVAEEADRLSGGDPDRQATLARLYSLAGRTDDAQAILASLKLAAENGYVAQSALARIYIGLGDHEAALDCLERAYQFRDGDLYLLKSWPVWDPLRDDPRFQELITKLDFPD